MSLVACIPGSPYDPERCSTATSGCELGDDSTSNGDDDVTLLGDDDASDADGDDSTIPGDDDITISGDDDASSSPSPTPVPPAAYRIFTYAGNGTSGYAGDGGPATAARLFNPLDVALNSAGDLFIADNQNHVVRRVRPDGTISTFAGTHAYGYSGDGGPATVAMLNYPNGVDVDGAGDLFIADYNNNLVRKVTTNGTITTVAGSLGYGYSGDGGPATAARLAHPADVAVNSAGELFITENGNHIVRKVAINGKISTLVGTGTAGYTGDGGSATEAELDEPIGIALDSAGDLFIADVRNNVIRKVMGDGTITTVAGNGYLAGGASGGYSGDGGPATDAELSAPGGISVGTAGDLFIADTKNSVIRQVTPDGTIFTIAGDGASMYGGDGGLATQAELNAPFGVVLDGEGTLYIADALNQRIRILVP